MGVMKKMKSFASVMAITLLLLAIFCNNLASADEFKLGRKLSQTPYGGGPSAPAYGGYGSPPYGGYPPPYSSSNP